MHHLKNKCIASNNLALQYVQYLLTYSSVCPLSLRVSLMNHIFLNISSIVPHAQKILWLNMHQNHLQAQYSFPANLYHFNPTTPNLLDFVVIFEASYIQSTFCDTKMMRCSENIFIRCILDCPIYILTYLCYLNLYLKNDTHVIGSFHLDCPNVVCRIDMT